MHVPDDIRDFATQQQAQQWADTFLQIWGGDSPWNPYRPSATVQPPTKDNPHWRVIGSRHHSAD